MELHSENVVWHRQSVTRERRAEALGGTGATIWLTGLPASGKSTIACALEQTLLAAGRPAYLLDGDNLRHGLNGNLGFSAEDRMENVRRVGEVARLFADAGMIALVSLISPFEEGRAQVRAQHESDGLRFVEVYVNTPLAECERRDPKGLYARARAGEVDGMTGVDHPYEEPQSPDVELRPLEQTVEESVAAVLAALESAAGRT